MKVTVRRGEDEHVLVLGPTHRNSTTNYRLQSAFRVTAHKLWKDVFREEPRRAPTINRCRQTSSVSCSSFSAPPQFWSGRSGFTKVGHHSLANRCPEQWPHFEDYELELAQAIHRELPELRVRANSVTSLSCACSPRRLNCRRISSLRSIEQRSMMQERIARRTICRFANETADNETATGEKWAAMWIIDSPRGESSRRVKPCDERRSNKTFRQASLNSELARKWVDFNVERLHSLLLHMEAGGRRGRA